MTDKAIERLARLRSDFPLFAGSVLKIRDKAENLLPLELNSAQRYLHERLEKQRAETGKVRAIVLKGRQQGISTYVGGRYYHRCTMNKRVNVYILAHEQPATDSLFSMVERYQDNNELAPKTGTANAKELRFERLDSGYIVATAGQKAGGRSRTISLFHGSEVAFWTNASAHFMASVQTVPDMPGTEIILESTAMGPSGEFYERWNDAVAGKSDYEAIFIPWFWQEEYRSPVDDSFELSDEAEEKALSEVDYARLFKLDNEQMMWRRRKISEFRSALKFDQEYPATPEMAFITADIKSLISFKHVLEARKRPREKGYGPKILGIDPAGPGGDRFAIALRQGFSCPWIKTRNKLGAPEALAWIRSEIDEVKPDVVFIDAGGLGASIISMIRAESEYYAKLVKGVNFGSTSEHKLAKPKVPGPKNRRAEMWDRMREWLESEEGVCIPDDNAIQADLTAPKLKPTSTNDFYLESKEDMRSRGVPSPDMGDALALTFATLRASRFKAERPAQKSSYQQDRDMVRPSGYFPSSSSSWMA